MWLVEMHTGQRGPSHVFDTEQVLHLVEGQASVAVDGAQVALAPGDTLVIPEGTERQVFAATSVRMVVCSRGDGIVSVPGETEPRGVPPWIG
jgi:quercetin dioxygenase-like cupin family protein